MEKQKATKVVAPTKADCFDSTDARLLFNLMPEESVLECLFRRTEMMKAASFDDSCLEELVAGIDSVSDLTVKQREKLKMQCL